jgi:hypothetical protein
MRLKPKYPMAHFNSVPVVNELNQEVGDLIIQRPRHNWGGGGRTRYTFYPAPGFAFPDGRVAVSAHGLKEVFAAVNEVWASKAQPQGIGQ